LATGSGISSRDPISLDRFLAEKRALLQNCLSLLRK
jgi:hypothetical protein